MYVLAVIIKNAIFNFYFEAFGRLFARTKIGQEVFQKSLGGDISFHW